MLSYPAHIPFTHARRSAAAIAIAAVAVSACRRGPPPPPLAGEAPATIDAAWRFPAAAVPYLRAPNAMVTSNSDLASEAGVEILRAGGNAVDAAVATGFALAVTYPEAGNIGGGGFMIIRMADGRTAALDYREVAPRAATRDMFLRAGVAADASTIGHLSAAVPGAVAGLTAAQARYGRLSLARVMAPAIRLAEEGMTVDSALAASVRGDSGLLARFPAAAAIFLPGGAPVLLGTQLRQPDLARTLKRIAALGSDGFYAGETAALIAAEMQRNGGIITAQDLAAYRAVWREPLTTRYRGHTLLAMPPASSGGVTMTEIAGILGREERLPAYGSATHAHLVAAAFQRAFIDRNALLADPAFATVPIAQLTSAAHARGLHATIDRARATPTAELELRQIPDSLRATGARRGEGPETTHYSVVDAQGNAVSTTTTINNLYGSGVVVAGAGFFLNDEMDDFAAKPGQPNLYGLVEGARNEIVPGKRMLSAMSPTIVLDSRDRLLMIVGGRGGPRIITSTWQVISNVLDHGMSLTDAMRAPRIHHQSRPDSLRHEDGGLRAVVRDSLAAMGWSPTAGSASGSCTAILRAATGGWEGAIDPRSSGRPAGY